MDTKKIIIANWKCNPNTRQQAEHLLNSIKTEIQRVKEVETIICPPFVWLSLSKSKIALGAQDCLWEKGGPYTGEISPWMLKELGVEYVIIGHSERRKHFQETDEMINKKIKAALKARLKPILCVGEEAKDSFDANGKLLNETSLIIGEQLAKDIQGISANQLSQIIIAYEPVWAIGTGNPCLPDDAVKSILFLRKTISKLYSRKIAEKVKIIYGGSINEQNAAGYLEEISIDGLLIGGASLNASEFVRIIKKVK